MFRYKLRTLLILLAIGPPLVGWLALPVIQWFTTSRDPLNPLIQPGSPNALLRIAGYDRRQPLPPSPPIKRIHIADGGGDF